MALDTRYIPSKYFQEGILDKDTGCLLAAGVVKFYADNARTTPKEVFRISGSPPNYTYTSIGTEVTLSAIGTFQDGSGNDIVPYFFPYDSNGNLELYYITVESAGGVPQFTQEGVPNLADRDVEGTDVNNYISNGQFLLHADEFDYLVVTPTTGKIVADSTIVAQGGWTFERSAGSTASDFVFFDRFDSYVSIPSASPRYAIRVKNTVPDATDTIKRLKVTFKDVNKFASDSDFYTFSFTGKSDSGAPANINVQQIKNFGTGGDAEVPTTLQPIILSTSYETYNVPFIPGDNSGKTIGTDNDDTISFAIEFPTSFTFESSYTNFVLTDGDVALTSFPPTPDEKFVRDSLAGATAPPDYKNADLYLPLLNGPNGYEVNRSVIGDYVEKSDNILAPNELWCNGEDYFVDMYSFVGIPFRRLYERWSQASPIGLSIYGVGVDEMGMINIGAIPTATYQLLSRNAGAVTPAADGATPTNFTFTPVAPNPYQVDITFLAASTLSGGEYWTYHNILGQKIIVWYEIGGSGTQPAESAHAYRKVSLAGTEPATTVGLETAIMINSYVLHLPDWRGYFIRITDDNGGAGAAGRDPGAATRLNRGDWAGGNVVGTTQTEDVGPHDHPYNNDTLVAGGDVAGGTDFKVGLETPTPDTGLNAGVETRPLNRYLNLAVIY
jgi:hypothetical protein